MIRFDIAGTLGRRPTVVLKLMREAMQRRLVNRRGRIRRNTTHPGDRTPVFNMENVPDFEIVIVMEHKRGNIFEARLRWLMLGETGDFPVIPESEAKREFVRTPTMAPHGFKQERLAVIEAAHQATALTDQFMQWATDEGE